MVTLNQAVAVAMVDGPAGRPRPARPRSTTDDRLAGHHRLHAVRAHLLEMAGDLAARPRQLPHGRPSRTTSLPEQRYLEERAARLGG